MYIDVGALWCRPCIEGIPEWNRTTHGHKAGSDVHFILVSLDDTKGDWTNWRRRSGRSRLLPFAGTVGFLSQFAKHYEVHTLPTCILIDQNGLIVFYPAPEHGSVKLRELLAAH